MSPIVGDVYVLAAVAVVVLMTVVWAFSVRLRDASIIDAFWSLGFVLVAGIAFVHGPGRDGASTGWVQAVLMGLVVVWGLRLAGYIAARNHGEPEDRRYQAMRARRGASFWWQSLFRVFYLQGALMLFIAAPLVVALASTRGGWRWTDVVGLVAWLVGFAFEAIGDAQLARFKRDPANRGTVLDRGLWRYTRHPNYFGEALLWWGFFAFALAAPGGWWTLPAPLLMTFLLLRVSGVSLLEKDITERRPAYRDYIRKTSAFVPWFPREEADSDS